MTLSIYLNGRCILSQPYRTAQAPAVAHSLAHLWSELASLGRLLVTVTQDNVTWIVR